jgi:hypothetical protein
MADGGGDSMGLQDKGALSSLQGGVAQGAAWLGTAESELFQVVMKCH